MFVLKESNLVKQCRQGQGKAQHALYDCYAERFFRLAYRYVKHQADAEDIVMTAFVKIFRHMKTFNYKGEGSLEAWMRKIVVNESLMWLRKKYNFNLTETLDSDFPMPDLESFKEMEAEYLYQLITELPPGYRTVFNLFVIEGYDHQEIAAMLKISESTSRSQLFKAKVLLKKKIRQEGMQYGT